MKQSQEYIPTGWQVAAHCGQATLCQNHDGSLEIRDGSDQDVKDAEEWARQHLGNRKPIPHFTTPNKPPVPIESAVFEEIRKEDSQRTDRPTPEQKIIDAAREIAKLRSPDIAGLLYGRGHFMEGRLVSRLVVAMLEYEPDLIRQIHGDPMENRARYLAMVNETSDAVQRAKPHSGPPHPLSAFGWIPPE